MRRGALLFVFILCLCGCKDETVSPHRVGTVDLAIDDMGTTEAYLRIHLSGATSYGFVLTRDGQLVMSAASSPADTTVNDEPLLPGRTYTYQTYRLSGNVRADSSGIVQARTMDSTSHNLQWTVDTLGVAYSILWDCQIISENDIWVVGEFYELDSLGNVESQPHNAAHWDGAKWSILRIMFPICGPTGDELGIAPVATVGVSAFSTHDVWFASSGSFVRWTDQVFSRVCMPLGYGERNFNKSMWSGNNLFLAGTNGFIAYYSGSTWQKIESRTSVDVQDVWGGTNRNVGTNVAMFAASNEYTAGEKKLLRVNSTGVLDAFPWPMQDRTLHSVWFAAHSPLYVCGDGVFVWKGTGWKEITEIPAIYENRIRGNAENDVFVVGDFGLVAHGNGSTWHVYSQFGMQGIYHSLDVKGNTMIAVGEITVSDNSTRGIVLRGTRSQ